MQVPDTPLQGRNVQEQSPGQMTPMQTPVMPMQTGFPMLSQVPPVVSQPQQQPNIIADVQNCQQAVGIPAGVYGPISWSSGIFQCSDDIPVCVFGSLCCYIMPCYLSAAFGEICCLGFLPGALFTLRTGLRGRYKIPGNLLRDNCAICCCTLCAMCQMLREMKYRERQQMHFTLWHMPSSN